MPNIRGVARFTIKQTRFSTRRSREDAEDTEEKGFGASRGGRSNTARTAIVSFSVALRAFSLLLRVKNLAFLL